MTAPLDGILVVDFSQFLSGPYASLKLLDLGARVIKVENPDGGDLCRSHYVTNTRIGEDSTLFHAINRGKESIAINLKTAEGLEMARKLVAHADVVIQNFRPGVIERLRLGYQQVRQIKKDIIYGSVSGYGTFDVWQDQPGQDLLAQARSGIMWLSGNADDGPVPVGLPIADISAGASLAQGILAALFRQARTGEGSLVETSLLESLIDLQFEFLTTYAENNRKPPARLAQGSAHGYLAAPYGVYRTANGYLALAMSPLDKLAELLDEPRLKQFTVEPSLAFEKRDEIFDLLQKKFLSDDAESWEASLSKDGIWCARILNWDEMLSRWSPGLQDVKHQFAMPLRMSGNLGSNLNSAPALDEHRYEIIREFRLC